MKLPNGSSIAAMSALAAMAALFPLIVACEKEPQWKQRAYVQHSSGSAVGEVRLPEAMWKLLIDPERPLKNFLGKSTEEAKLSPEDQEKEKASAVVKSIVETDLKPLAVYFIEQSHGVLGGRNHKIQFGPGGGEIDLRDFVQEDRGAFRVVFEFAPELDPKIAKRVWYLSNARKRRLGNDTVGAGCATYMDISSVVNKSLKDEGLLVAIGDGRHVSALAGTFFFSTKNGSRTEVSRVTIYDSSKRALHCQGQLEAPKKQDD
ncbi:MAG: hypothetical protein U1E10_17895 [Bdellovibrionales bacterium]|nr:hypothetical protein [Bdellovibrionales bacterium]